MGLSVVISGAIIMIALMFVLYSIPPLITSVTSVGETSTQISDLENTILQTEISLDTLIANSSVPSVTFNLNNINIEKLWDYENFDVLVTYDADVSGKKTSITETIPFNILNKSYTILASEVSTNLEVATAGYDDIPDLTAKLVNVAGPDSHILFHANVSFLDEPGGGGDCTAQVALFIDGAMVAEAIDFSDDDAPLEPGNIGLSWWETGLAAGTHDFDVRWSQIQNNCEIETLTEQSMQVIEFTPGDGVPTILTEVTNFSDESYPLNLDQSIDGMTDSPTIEGPDSLVITTGTVSFDETGAGSGSDNSCHLGIFIDGNLQAEQHTFSDGSDFGSSASVMWAETGLSAGSHTIDLQAREIQGGCTSDIAMQKHMQVVEYTSGNPTILEGLTSTNGQTMNAGYEIITGLETQPPGTPLTIDGPGSVVLFTATVSFATNPTTSEGDVALFIDDNMVAEGRTYLQTNANRELGNVNIHWWETGLSAGPHTFDVRGKEGTVGAETDTVVQSHMQVIEFPCIKQWNILSITDDVLDPGLINPEETAKISVELCNPIFLNGNVVVSVSTDNGITATIGGIAT